VKAKAKNLHGLPAVITPEWLRKAGICRLPRWFKREYPKGLRVNRWNLLAVADNHFRGDDPRTGLDSMQYRMLWVVWNPANYDHLRDAVGWTKEQQRWWKRTADRLWRRHAPKRDATKTAGWLADALGL
jgi:hypothetical protein